MALIAGKFTQAVYMKASQMEVQGALANLLDEEDTYLEWKSMIFSVPRGVMARAAMAPTNSIASPDNLARLTKRVHPKYPLCSVSPHTLRHLLKNCS